MFRSFIRRFSKVESYTAMWCNIDRLNGKPLEDGEHLLIRLCPKEIIDRRITVWRWDEPDTDMGYKIHIPHSKAYIKEDGVEIPLAGVLAQRIN